MYSSSRILPCTSYHSWGWPKGSFIWFSALFVLFEQRSWIFPLINPGIIIHQRLQTHSFYPPNYENILQCLCFKRKWWRVLININILLMSLIYPPNCEKYLLQEEVITSFGRMKTSVWRVIEAVMQVTSKNTITKTITITKDNHNHWKINRIYLIQS